TDSTQGLVTRMYGQMKDGLTFIGLAASNLTIQENTLLSAIPGAIVGGIIQVNYLISQYASYWSNTTNTYYDGEYIDQNIEDQLELLKATRKALAENEVPSIDVTVSEADLYKIDNTATKANMGDIVHLIDPLMELNNMTARVVEMTEYPYQLDKHSTVTLANYMLRDYKDIIADLDTSKRIVDDLISGGRVRASAFEEYARQAVIDINNSKTQVIYDGRGIILQSIVNPLHQVVESAEGIYLTIDGGLTALAAITANGIIADRIIGTIGSFVQISADSIVTGSLNGINMQIGSGANSFHADASGISLGGTTWAGSPFRVNMLGDAWATSMTLNTPAITNGSIVGTTLNIGSGQFTVDAAGHLDAQSGTFHGDITSGSTITGAIIRTSNTFPRLQFDATDFSQYNSSGTQVIRMSSSYSQPRIDMTDIANGNRYGSFYTYNGMHLQSDNFPLYIDAIGSIVYINGYDVISILGGKTNVGSSVTSTSVADGHNHGFSTSDFIQCYDAAGVPTIKKQWVPYGGSPTHSHYTT
ncbi:MAG: phage tail protein, partial [Paenibacillaceae bacterium]